MDSVVGHTMLRGYADMDVSSVTPVLVCDAAGGTHGAFAVLAALNHLERTGEGQLIELAQAEAFIPMLGAHFMDYSMNRPERRDAGEQASTRHPGLLPVQGNRPLARRHAVRRAGLAALHRRAGRTRVD